MSSYEQFVSSSYASSSVSCVCFCFIFSQWWSLPSFNWKKAHPHLCCDIDTKPFCLHIDMTHMSTDYLLIYIISGEALAKGLSFVDI